MELDLDQVNEIVGRVVADIGATDGSGAAVIGHRLGLYRALAEGPATAQELARRTSYHPRYLAEWLGSQAAGGYVDYDPATRRFSLSAEQAFCLADPAGPNLAAAFQISLGRLRAVEAVTEAFRTGGGVGWPEHHLDVAVGLDAFYRPAYAAALVPAWIPALDGVEAKLRSGARVADVGCGLGAASVLVAQAYDQVSVFASDYHAESIELAAKHAAEAGVGDRVSFEVATAQAFGGSGFDLVMMLDTLHDLGDPVGAARRVRETLAEDGTWLLVEPYASDRLEDNFTPVGRAYLNASLLACVPNGLSQAGGYALGAVAGEAATREVVGRAGFSRFRRVAETPFNLVYEVRP